MPYFGLLSFLLFCGDFRESSFKGSFNALLRASFFSTVRLNNNGTNNEFCFNALLRASFFSTNGYADTYNGKAYTGFNALLRASFFSTGKFQNFYIWMENVSMPYFGLLSFLLGNSKTFTFGWKTFQCPTSGFFLFYLEG